MKTLGVIAAAVLLCSACGDDGGSDGDPAEAPVARPTAVVTECSGGGMYRLEVHLSNPLDVAVVIRVSVALKDGGTVLDEPRLHEVVDARSDEDIAVGLTFRISIKQLVCDVTAVEVEELGATAEPNT